MLRFIYTDALPGDEELVMGSSSAAASAAAIVDLFQDLLAAADMYQLDRLKPVAGLGSRTWVAKMPLIALQDIQPGTFRALLRFVH
ncbi:hypothetical protein U9M48_038192 [Paspalum notatum var. saurae]|uniref:BTB domain-containing protein n=1 Tax=Paspalum notatum var. saurae TaxID=547442 RepID=A0AAQ3ULD6_PASNO